VERRTAGGAVALLLAVCAVLVGGTTAAGAPPDPPPPQPQPQPGEPPAPPVDGHVDLHLPAHPTRADLDRVRAVVTDLTGRVQRASDALQQAAGGEVELRVELAAAARRRDDATAALEHAVRAVYEGSGGSRALGFVALGFVAGLSPADTETGQRAGTGALQVDAGLLRDRTAADREMGRLSAAAGSRRRSLLAQAAPLELAQAQARDALDQAAAVFAADADAAAAAGAAAVLATQRAALDAASAQVALAVTPAVTAGGLASATAQAPVLAALEATPLGGVPVGFHRTGRAIAGSSSWYGPGFVGSPTSSGAPYDPEKLTCAMLAVPLGTVVRVTTNAGRVITVLVTDHGPYVPGTDRVIDLSARAARIVGVGLTPVTVEVLARD